MITWDESKENAFSTLKMLIIKEPIPKLPDLKKSFTLGTDASDFGIGAVLMQEHENQLFPASKKLSKREKAYATVEKECLAVIWAVKKFMMYLYGKEFILQTDHQSFTTNRVLPETAEVTKDTEEISHPECFVISSNSSSNSSETEPEELWEDSVPGLVKVKSGNFPYRNLFDSRDKTNLKTSPKRRKNSKGSKRTIKKIRRSVSPPQDSEGLSDECSSNEDQGEARFYQDDPCMPIFKHGRYSPVYADFFKTLVDKPNMKLVCTKLPPLVEDNLSFLISTKSSDGVPLSDIGYDGHSSWLSDGVRSFLFNLTTEGEYKLIAKKRTPSGKTLSKSEYVLFARSILMNLAMDFEESHMELWRRQTAYELLSNDLIV
ncbi:Retrovirus-related Pol polyprotein from transposon 297 [Exaiptasia diaphana]|nr:Retrovirus-related Pol polyprotein from transposon 297 [Exaiptasia diaphana]